jgi:hypothetical protein
MSSKQTEVRRQTAEAKAQLIASERGMIRAVRNGQPNVVDGYKRKTARLNKKLARLAGQLERESQP